MGTVDKITKEVKRPGGKAAVATFLGGPLLGSTVYGSEVAKEAGEDQAAAAREAQDIQRQQFLETKEMLTPFISGSRGAYERQQALSGALGPEAQAAAYQEYQESPGVAFQREQGTKAATQAMAARGGLGGGSRLKAISEFNQGLALQDFTNQFNRLGAVTGVGLGAATSLGGFGAQSAAGQGQAIQQAAGFEAAGNLGRAQAIQGGISDAASLLGFAYGGGGYGGGRNPNAYNTSSAPSLATSRSGVGQYGSGFNLGGPVG